MKSLLKRLIPETSPIRLLFHRAKAFVAAVRYGFPAKKLTVIGVTGTDGKTTAVGMIAHMLNECGIRTGALSTAFFQVGKNMRWNPTQKTSPSPFLVQKFLRELVESGCTHAMLECSSHGLLQGRMNHTYPTVAAITNVSEEHLDYHGTMGKYIAAKAILFRMLRGKGTKILHSGDRSASALFKIRSEKTILYDAGSPPTSGEGLGLPTVALAEVGVGVAQLSLTNIETRSEKSSATLVWNAEDGSRNYPLTLRVPGRFNLDNALCAIGCVKAVNNPPEMSSIIRALSSFRGIAGRMERIDAGQNFSVYVDFTVTPKSYEATLSTLRESLAVGSKLLVLMGSCGDRMKEKRPVIGGIAARFADIIVVTNEDPYTEDPEKIIDDVLAGMPKDLPIFREHIPENSKLLNKFCIRISNRLTAIKTILSLAKSCDTVIFCGKGSDTTMMIASGQVPWDEREIVTVILRDAFADAHAPQYDNTKSQHRRSEEVS